jgi:Uma2 family endonuclease
MTAHGVRFNANDIWDTPDDGNRYEVIDGALHVSPPPSYRHQRVVVLLLLRLGAYVEQRRLGQVLTAPLGVKLDDDTGVQPDLIFVSTARSDIIAERGLEGAPDLVVEVLSPSTRARDRGVKMGRYAAARIPVYWIVDPVTCTIEEYSLGADEGYELAASLGAADVFRPTLFPGLEISRTDLLC